MPWGATPELHFIEKGKRPQRELENHLRRCIDDLLDADGRSLLIIHYAGHGSKIHGDLMFTGGDQGRSKSICWTELLRNATTRTGLDDNDPIDIFFILDSCFSGLATRKKDVTKRIVEVVAAVNATGTALGNDPNNPRIQARTFTSKIADYLARMKGKNVDSVDFTSAIAALVKDSPEKKPTHKILMGRHGIRVNLTSRPQASSSRPTVERKEMQALVRVHLAQTLTTDDAANLKEWIGALDNACPLTLDGVFQADSSILLVPMSHSTFLNVTSDAVQLVALVKSENLLKIDRLPTSTNTENTNTRHLVSMEKD